MEVPRALPRAGVVRNVGSRPSTVVAGRHAFPAAAGRRWWHARVGGGRRSSLPLRALPPDAAQHAADLLAALPDALAHVATLAYEPVAAPCSLMNCGDVVYRSTLDPVLRREVAGPDWRALAAIAGVAGAYLFAPPGVLPGAYDYYVRTPLYRRYGGKGSLRALDRDDLVLGRRLGAGGFGDVYRATLSEGVPGFPAAASSSSTSAEDDAFEQEYVEEDRSVVVKRAKEFGEAEAWMNERMARESPDSVAGFVAAFEERAEDADGGGAAAERRRRQKRRAQKDRAGAAVGAGGLFGLLGGARRINDSINGNNGNGGNNGDDDEDDEKKQQQQKKKKKKQQKQQQAAQFAPPAAVWLVWRDEGDNTLADLMGAREWPYSAEQVFLGRELRLPRGARRRAVTVRLAMRQLLECIAACHRAGIVHRDIKPQNAIVATRGGSAGAAAAGAAGPFAGEAAAADDDDDGSTTTTTASPPVAVGRLKLIDLGAAADLRIGINYAPSEYLMDPRYAPPQQYIMQRQTSSPPPKPVAALLSPVLWAVGRPDRFDSYSAGVTLMQMAFPPLRTDNGLFQFRKKLEEAGWDLREWRRRVEGSEGGKGAKGGNGKDGSKGGGGARALFGALLSSAASSLGAGSSPAFASASASAASSGYAAGFELLDLDGGQGWDLACGLLALQPGDRLSAGGALRHPWLARAAADAATTTAPGPARELAAGTAAVSAAAARLLERADERTGGRTTAVAAAAREAGGRLGRAVAEAAGGSALLESALTHGAGRDGALTEAQLADEFGYSDVASVASLEAAAAAAAAEAAAAAQQQQQRNARQQMAKKKKIRDGNKQSPFGALFGGVAGIGGEEEEEEEEEEDEQAARPKLPALFGGGLGGGGLGGGAGPAGVGGPPRNARRTIAWWQDRQTDLQRELAARRRNVSRTIRGVFGEADAQQARRERDARQKRAAGVKKQQQQQQQQGKPSAVVAVPARPAMFGGGGGGRRKAVVVAEEAAAAREKEEEEEEVTAAARPERRPAARERPGSPAAIAWLTALLPPPSQPSTVAEKAVQIRHEEEAEGQQQQEQQQQQEEEEQVAAAAERARARR